MTQQRLNEINKLLYDDAKIYEVSAPMLSKTYTSTLFERLKTQGWEKELHNGICNIKDLNGKIVVQEIGTINALNQLAKIMQ